MRLIHWLASLLVTVACATAQAGTLDYTTYYHNDHLGSPAAATDERGDVLWRAHYRPYGERQEDPKSANFGNLGYTGHAQDPDSQLVYAGARYYDPLIGRFLAVDPAPVASSAPGSFNRYSYTLNNPYRFTDPNGESPSPTDVYHFAVDVGNLLVQEAVYVAAISVNDQAVANLAIEGMVEARVDAAISTAGLISPAPGVAPTLKAARAAEKVASAVHGNSRLSQNAQHVYEIRNTHTGEVVKTGISQSKITAAGKSPRAERQRNKWGSDSFETTIIAEIPAGPGAREAALRIEKLNAQGLKQAGQLGKPEYHRRP